MFLFTKRLCSPHTFQKKRTAHERAKELYASGEFSSGRRWADDAPREKVDTSGVNLIDSGACGAFVHGLEDEMYGEQALAVPQLLMLCRLFQSCKQKQCLNLLFGSQTTSAMLRWHIMAWLWHRSYPWPCPLPIHWNSWHLKVNWKWN